MNAHGPARLRSDRLCSTTTAGVTRYGSLRAGTEENGACSGYGKGRWSIPLGWGAPVAAVLSKVLLTAAAADLPEPA